MNIHRPPSRRKEQHGIHIDSRGQDQPVDKSRAQQTSVGEGCPEEKAHCDAATPPWDPPGVLARRARYRLITLMLQTTTEVACPAPTDC